MKSKHRRSLVFAFLLSAFVLSSCATVSKLLEMGSDQAYGQGGTIAGAAPLMRAIKLRDYTRALSLVSQGVGEGEYVASPKDATPLELAVAHGRLDVVKAIADRLWFDQESGERALVRAAELEQSAIVDYLIAKGCTVGSSYALYAFAMKTPSHAVMSLFIQAPHPSYKINNFGNGYGTADPGPFLVQASLHGYADLVDKAIKLQAKTESSACLSGYMKATPLWAASAMGHADCVRLLLAAGVKVDAAVAEYRYTPLMMAARGGHADVCKLLIEAGANVNAKSATAFVSDWFQGTSTITYTRNDVKQRSPILFAASSGSFQTVKALIDAGVDVNQPNDEGWTAMLAVRADLRADLAAALLKAGATEHPLMSAIYAGNAAALRKELPNLKAFLAAQKLAIYPLTMAVRWHAVTKSYEVVDILLAQRQDLPTQDMEKALRAAKKENPELYRYLLDTGGLKEEYPDYAPSTYELLAERIAANDTSGFKSVHASPSAKLGMLEKKQILEEAILAGRVEIVRFLIGEGYALNALWPVHRDSMLGDAAISGSLDLVKLLLDSGADIDPKLASVGLELYPYRTPFMAACESGSVTIAKYLVEKGADVSRVGFEGYTALAYALRSGNKAMVDYVISLKVNLDERMDILRGMASGVIDRKRETALMQAVQAGSIIMVRQLLAAGADPRLTDWVQDDALALAVRLGHGEIESVLRSALGDVYK